MPLSAHCSPMAHPADVSSLEKSRQRQCLIYRPLSALLLCCEATLQLNCVGCQRSAELCASVSVLQSVKARSDPGACRYRPDLTVRITTELRLVAMLPPAHRSVPPQTAEAPGSELWPFFALSTCQLCISVFSERSRHTFGGREHRLRATLTR